MAVLSHRLARLLGDRIRDILPPPLTIEVSGDRLVLFDGDVEFGASHSAAVVDWQPNGTPRQGVAIAVGSVLSEIQDHVMEHLTLQWPVDAEGHVGMPYVGTDRLQAWSGFAREDGTPIVHLRSIRFSDLAGGSDQADQKAK